jgi:hypothetical protein
MKLAPKLAGQTRGLPEVEVVIKPPNEIARTKWGFCPFWSISGINGFKNALNRA